MGLEVQHVLQFDRELQLANTVDDVLRVTRDAIERLTGYRHATLSAFEAGPPPVLQLVGIAGVEAERLKVIKSLPVENDLLMAELLKATGPVVVDDARTDPRPSPANQAIFKFGTIINVPVMLDQNRLGMLNTGTYLDEGPRPPTADQLAWLSVIAAQLAGTFHRLQRDEARRRFEQERADLARRLAGFQRLESLALLAGGVAHDFNNLVSVMMGNLHLIAEGPLTPTQRGDLEETLTAARRATDLTRQLLAIGRRQALELQPNDLNHRLQELSRLLTRTLGSGVSLTLSCAPELPPVLGDGGQLDQVFLNLCINARDAMPHGGRLTIETSTVVLNGNFIAAHPWARVGRFVLVTITDTGQGMTPEVLEHLFEPFFTTKPSGTGLGLASSKGIIEQHRGMLHAYSEPGKGTTFRVYLPALQGTAPEVAPASGPAALGHERILVAEDDPATLESLRKLLAQAGYTVVTVRTGQEAVRAGCEAPFDLVVLDGVMPEVSGLTAFERIRVVRPSTRFLFVSGFGQTLAPPELVAAHGLRVLPKPVDPDALLRAVREALDRPT